MSQTWFNRMKLMVGGSLLLFAALTILEAFRGPPSKEGLTRIDGIVVQVRREEDSTILLLAEGKGSYKYYDDQPKYRRISSFPKNQQITLLIDDRLSLVWWRPIIWGVKRADETLISYEQMFNDYPGSRQGFVCSSIVLGILGIVVLNLTEVGDHDDEKMSLLRMLGTLRR